MRDLITLVEAARLLRVGRSTIYRLADSGELVVLRIGRCLRVRPEALEEFAREHEQKNGSARRIAPDGRAEKKHGRTTRLSP